MTKDEQAILRGMVRVALYHNLSKNEWMAKVVPGVEELLGVPLSEEVVDRIHQAFKDEWPPEMAIEEIAQEASNKESQRTRRILHGLPPDDVSPQRSN